MKKKIKKFLHNFYKGAYAVGYRHVSDSKRNYRRVHTLNKMGNLEVIDLLYYQINPTILLEKAKRVIKK